MARPASKHPTELELRILKILWGHGPAPVRFVRDELQPTRKLAYTSVMTIMNIMVDKGYLTRNKEGPSYVYHPRVSEKDTTRRMLKDLVNRAFDGSAVAVMVNLLESGDVDEAELRRIREIVDRKSGEEQP